MKYFLSIVGLFIAILIGTYFGVSKTPAPIALGSVANTPYKATTTNAYWNGTNYPTKTVTLKLGSGYLGSVVITGATAAAGLKFYDGTTTLAHALYATTTIANINPSTPANTYTYDVSFTRGLIVEFPDAIGAASSTITFQ